MDLQSSTLPSEPQPPRARGAHYTGDRPTRKKLDLLYNKQKLSSGEIARRYSVTRKTVTNWLEIEGFARRTGTEAGRLRFAIQAEYVPLAEREDCLLDRAWEARPERRLRDKVACRLCFQLVSRLTGKTGHLANHHERMTGAEYARLMPGHRHDCFQHSPLDVEELMDKWCAEWANADEVRMWRRDPKLAQAQEYVGCLECGRKSFGGAEIQKHTRNIHNWSPDQYKNAYPGAPTGSLKRRAMQAEISKTNYANRKAEFARLRALEAQRSPKPKGKRGRPSKVELFKEARVLSLQGRTWPQCAEMLLPEEVKKDGRTMVGERLRKGVEGLSD
jgi:hypothetical protein